MKRADCSRGCDGSQERADGSNIFNDARSLVMGRNGWVSNLRAGVVAATANSRVANKCDWFATGCDRVNKTTTERMRRGQQACAAG